MGYSALRRLFCREVFAEIEPRRRRWTGRTFVGGRKEGRKVKEWRRSAAAAVAQQQQHSRVEKQPHSCSRSQKRHQSQLKLAVDTVCFLSLLERRERESISFLDKADLQASPDILRPARSMCLHFVNY